MIEKYQKIIHTMVSAVAGPHVGNADLEDLISEVNLKLLEKGMAAYDPERGTTLSTWIGQIAKNAAIDALRRLKHTVSPDDVNDAGDPRTDWDPALASHTEDALTMLIKAEQRERMAIAVARLDMDDQKFLKAVLSDDFDCDNYAERNGVKSVAIRVRKSRLADKLRGLLKNERDN